jgi:hypothetical protein
MVSNGARPRLTVGMACFDDYNGVYFSIQALQMYHADVWDDLEILVVDNHPAGKDGQAVRDFVTSWVPRARYIAAPDVVGTAAPRDLIFQEAAGDAVLCIDAHVLLEAGSLRRLLQYYDAHPTSLDLLHGPMLDDRCRPYATHMDPVWRQEMFGVWGSDPRGMDPDAPPFEIPMHGCGLMSCSKEAWLGFHPDFRGFGGEEGYIHQKYRQAGRRVLCLPFLRWLHRFGRPSGVSYPLTLNDRLRNYLLGRRELNQPYDDVLDHFAPRMSRGAIDRILSELGLPSLIDFWFKRRPAEPCEATGAGRDSNAACPAASGRTDSAAALSHVVKRQQPCFNLILSTPRTMHLNGASVSCETISYSPRVEVVHNILSETEAGEILRLALPRMQPSKVYLAGSTPTSEIRTSFSAPLRVDQGPLAAKLYERLAAVLDCPVDHLETVQVNRYQPGQFFVEHYDYIPEHAELYRDGGQRLKSVVVYLNHLPADETGATTLFPRLHLQLRCALGTGIVWDNVDTDGKLETRSLHVGVAPVKSTKFALACFRRARTVAPQLALDAA